MKSFVKIMSDNYCISKVTYICSICGAEFYEYVPATYELVGFKCSDGYTRYLPSYGKGGYLDLLSRLVPEWMPNKPITTKISQNFIGKLSELCPYKLSLLNRTLIQCLHCTSKKIHINREERLKNPPIKWIEIPKDLYESL